MQTAEPAPGIAFKTTTAGLTEEPVPISGRTLCVRALELEPTSGKHEEDVDDATETCPIMNTISIEKLTNFMVFTVR